MGFCNCWHTEGQRNGLDRYRAKGQPRIHKDGDSDEKHKQTHTQTDTDRTNRDRHQRRCWHTERQDTNGERSEKRSGSRSESHTHYTQTQTHTDTIQLHTDPHSNIRTFKPSNIQTFEHINIQLHNIIYIYLLYIFVYVQTFEHLNTYHGSQHVLIAHWDVIDPQLHSIPLASGRLRHSTVIQREKPEKKAGFQIGSLNGWLICTKEQGVKLGGLVVYIYLYILYILSL
jgi:hypothetical protein